MPPTEYHVNGGFDLALRQKPPDPSRWRATLSELETLALLLGRGSLGDTALLGAPVGHQLLEALAVFDPALPVDANRCNRAARYAPSGWDPAAIARNRLYERPAPHPPLQVIRRVNGRGFAARLARDLGLDDAWIGEACSLEELDRLRSGPGSSMGGWLLKAEHGNAALAQRRVGASPWTGRDLAWIQRTLNSGDRIHMERWQDRQVDICTTFSLHPDGKVSALSSHETCHAPAGGFRGARWNVPSVRPWVPELREVATRVAAALHQAGYFGEVALDSYVHRQGGNLQLRPLHDLNARRPISAGPRAAAARIAPDQPASWLLLPSPTRPSSPRTAALPAGIFRLHCPGSATRRSLLVVASTDRELPLLERTAREAAPC